MKNILEKLLNKENLNHLELREVFTNMMQGALSEIEITAFLVALRAKGETADEIFVAAEILRDFAIPVKVEDEKAIDTCGTGGAKHKTFNVSTTVALVAAAAGVTVVKHGNRSNTGQSGSSDVLAALGVNLEKTKEAVEENINKNGIGFLFAPLYHPTMKHMSAVRKTLGIRTIFNLLGPLANPSKLTRQIIGVFDESLVETFAIVLKKLGTEKAIVVHGEGGFDEFSLCGKSTYALLENGEITLHTVSPEDFGLEIVELSTLQGGNPEENAEITKAIISGKDTSAKADLVALNTAAALFVADKVQTLEEGVKMALEVIAAGKGLEKLEALKN